MSSRKKYLTFVIVLDLALLVAVAGWIIFNRQYVLDQIQVWKYEPSSEVAALAERTTMSDRGKFFYYASQPSVETSATFNEDCRRQEEGSPILGCYRDKRIFIYNVTDERLDGIKEVTAAHETLHAIYERFSEEEREKVNTLLEAEYKKQGEKVLKDRMKYYERTQPGQRLNELHSIIGTEFLQLSDELEAHYKKYFTDRPAIARFFHGYNTKFNEVKNNITSIQAELTSLVETIEQQTAAYNRDLQTLNTSITDFNGRAETGDFTSQAEFAAERAKLVDQSQAVKQQREALEEMITNYNQKLKTYNSFVDESKELKQSIDSTLAPVPMV